MTLVTELKEGMALRLEDRLYRILEVLRHTGSGQMHGFVELKLKDIRFGHFADRRFKQSDRVELVELSKRQMEYLYADAESFYFMDPQTFEQVGVPKESVGRLDKLLKEGSKIMVELLGEEAISIQFPKVVEIPVASTGPGIREGQDNTMKSALLDNGMEILVPQFIVTGDHIRLDTEKLKYIDRVSTKHIS
jgi:elongation factor P